jgi:hypothetical protein
MLAGSGAAAGTVGSTALGAVGEEAALADARAFGFSVLAAAAAAVASFGLFGLQQPHHLGLRIDQPAHLGNEVAQRLRVGCERCRREPARERRQPVRQGRIDILDDGGDGGRRGRIRRRSGRWQNATWRPHAARARPRRSPWR